MADGTRIASVDEVPDRGSLLVTVLDPSGTEEEVIVVPCEGTGAAAWINRCTHEAQRLDTGRGAAMRDGEVICEVAVEDGAVHLVDDAYELSHRGGIDEGDDGPSSTSHIGF